MAIGTYYCTSCEAKVFTKSQENVYIKCPRCDYKMTFIPEGGEFPPIPKKIEAVDNSQKIVFSPITHDNFNNI